MPDQEIDNRIIGSVIRSLRKAKSLTLGDIGDPAGYDAGNLSRIERGKQSVPPEKLARICSSLGVSVGDFYRFAERLARGEEVDFAQELLRMRLRLPAGQGGSVQEPQATYGELFNVEPGPDIRGLCPLISWVQAGTFCEVIDNFAPGDADEWYPCPVPHGPHTYILRVRGPSMTAPVGPSFPDGELIFVDPDVAPANGKFVIVRLEDRQEATFKRLVIDGDEMYLEALNPTWPERIIKVTENATICGVVIFKGQPV